MNPVCLIPHKYWLSYSRYKTGSLLLNCKSKSIYGIHVQVNCIIKLYLLHEIGYVNGKVADQAFIGDAIEI